MMELCRSATRGLPTRIGALRNGRAAALACSPMAVWSRRQFSLSSGNPLPGMPGQSFGGSPSQPYFQRSRLPTNTVVKFVPQQTAWIVERMGKFSRILSPGLAILMPVIEVWTYCRRTWTYANAATADRLRSESQRISNRNSEPERNYG